MYVIPFCFAMENTVFRFICIFVYFSFMETKFFKVWYLYWHLQHLLKNCICWKIVLAEKLYGLNGESPNRLRKQSFLKYAIFVLTISIVEPTASLQRRCNRTLSLALSSLIHLLAWYPLYYYSVWTFIDPYL